MKNVTNNKCKMLQITNAKDHLSVDFGFHFYVGNKIHGTVTCTKSSCMRSVTAYFDIRNSEK